MKISLPICNVLTLYCASLCITLSDIDSSDKIVEILARVENFVKYFNTKVRQKSEKIVEISAWCGKFCPTKLGPIRYFLCTFMQVISSKSY